MDSNELNKIAGAAVGALLVFLLLGFFSGQIFGTVSTHHGEETLAFALEIEQEVSETEDAQTDDSIQLASLVASADPSAGEAIFRQCSACHKIEDGVNGVGPHLWNIVGRQIGAVDGYAYSNALASMDGDWDLIALSGFLENPSDWAPGTKMGYGGLKDAEDRVNMIAYLNEAGDAPVALSSMVPETDKTGSATDEASADVAETEVDQTETAAAGEQSTEDAPADVPSDAASTEEAASSDTTTDEAGAAMANATATDAPAVTESETTGPSSSEPQDTTTYSETSDGGEQPKVAAIPAETDTAPSQYADLLANASAESGKRVFNRCRACHQAEQERNGVGPHLYGVIGREIAGLEDYSYSDALAAKSGVWNLDNLMVWLENPANFAAGNKMGYQLQDPQARVDVITYLNEADGSPEPLN
ncbi:MAG: c-type cytochrome [Paracoccaceae bacterium]